MPETKTCPRCKRKFECNLQNITQCFCYGIELTAELKELIEKRFTDCLCRDCLLALQQENNLFRKTNLPG